MIEKIQKKAGYDSIARIYSQINEKRPLNKFAAYPTLFDAVGDVTGKRVLDLACGTGTVAREMHKRGAAKVVGIDQSKEMLKIARSQNRGVRGVEYKHGRVGTLGKIGEFEVVTGGFLLHYSKTKEELLHMCVDIALNLEPNGVFVALNNNPLHPFASSEKYENRVDVDLPLHEGSELRVTIKGEDATVPFTTYFWKKETYGKALHAAGLTDVEWVAPVPTLEGIQEMGADYWKEFLENAPMMVIKARKSVITPL
ncbi:MAG: class I SAM-dependent methyltransferase [bacterium]|nr:class I SAM-dependent methyltransferase [bacterium]